MTLPEQTTLHDGTPVTLRHLRPDDACRLQALHARLSPESIHLRFMAQLPALPLDEARRLADVDGQSRVALAAALGPVEDEQFIGVARYAVVKPGEAEAAIVVEDRYQRLGAATLLLDRLLAYARAHGIGWFTGEVSLENDRMVDFIRRSGLPAEMKLTDGVWLVRVRIAPEVESSVPA